MCDTPILIGSMALKMHGIEVDKVNDIDLIVSEKSAAKLAWLADSTKKDKSGNSALLFFNNANDTKTVLDVTLYTANPVYTLLWDMFNEYDVMDSNITQIELNSENNLEVRLAHPIELYAILKGHIHRIPKYSSSQSNNIKIWEKWMERYELLRKHNPLILDQLKSNKSYNKLYETQFNYINQKIGDAPSMDKAEEEFFEDNVKRYIPHDQLHQEVAQINRDTSDLLFRKFQLDETSVEMNEDLFLKAPRHEQLNTIREEVMVLYLERKLLPKIVEHNYCLGAFTSEDIRDFKDVVCHFITNLCGNGHAWLREWCLDHYYFFSDLYTYPIFKLGKFARSFIINGRVSGILQFKEEDDFRIKSFCDFNKYVEKVNKNNDTILSIGSSLYSKLITSDENNIDNNIILYNTDNPEYSGSDKPGDVIIEGKSFHTFNTYNEQLESNNVSICVNIDELVNDLVCEEEQSIVKQFLIKYFVNKESDEYINDILILDGSQNDYYHYVDNESLTNNYSNSNIILYNVNCGLGIYLELGHNKESKTIVSYGWIFFIEANTTKSRYTVEQVTFGVHQYSFTEFYANQGESYTNKDESYNLDKRNSSYYISTCNGGYDKPVDLAYINHYGSIYYELEKLTELLARTEFDMYQDENEDQYRDY